MKGTHWKGLAAIFIAGSLVGCTAPGGSVSGPAEPEVVTVWHYYNGPQKSAFDELVQEFNETAGSEKNIIVEPVSLGTLGGLIQAVTESSEGKIGSLQLPQLAAAYADTALELDQKGLLADINPYLTEEELSAYVDAYVEEGRFGEDGSLKIFPTAKSTEVLTLNLTAWAPFARDTGTELEALSTWEGVARTAEAYYRWTDAQTPEPLDGKAFFGRDAMANYLLAGSHQLGHNILEVTDGTVTLDFDREVMKTLWDAYYLPYVKGYYVAEGRFRGDDLKMGNLIAYVGATSGPYTPDTVVYEDGRREDITCAVLPVPNFEGTQPVAVQQGGGMVLFQGEEKTERAAVEFLKWFTQAETNLRFCMGSGYLPVRQDANTMKTLDQAIAASQEKIPDVLRQNLLVGMDEVNHYDLYTTKPFHSSQSIRGILADGLADSAHADRETVKALVAGGMSLDQALAELDPEARFSQWYETTYEQLRGLDTQG